MNYELATDPALLMLTMGKNVLLKYRFLYVKFLMLNDLIFNFMILICVQYVLLVILDNLFILTAVEEHYIYKKS